MDDLSSNEGGDSGLNAANTPRFREKPVRLFKTKVAAPESISNEDDVERSNGSLERFEGALFGLALGDAMGAPHEGGVLERALWRILGRTRDGRRRWTDDTQMSIDLAESLLESGGLDSEDLARRFASSYRWSRGYGPGAAKLLKRLRRGESWENANKAVFASGSYGNGGAMRAPVVGLYFSHRSSELGEAARASAVVTHAHPLGLDGARLIAAATSAAVRGCRPDEVMEFADAAVHTSAFCERLSLAKEWLGPGERVPASGVRQGLGNGIAALESAVTALYLALRFHDSGFSKLLDFVRELGGDVDTIGAMSGAIFGALNGRSELPRSEIDNLEQAERIQSLARGLHAAATA